MKRVVALIAAVLICASFLVVPASAEEVGADSLSYDWNRGGTHYTGVFALPRNTINYVAKNPVGALTAGNNYYTSIDQFALDEELQFSGSVALYVSYYYNVDTSVGGTWTTNPAATYQGYYKNDVGAAGTVPKVEFSSFTPANGTNPSEGFRMSVHFLGTPEMPISALGVKRTSTAAQCYFKPAASTEIDCNFYLNIPSARVVGVATSGELEALEGMANQIAAQNEILNAMYGDIVAICNSIYQACGDMVEAQNLTNQYFSQIIPLLNTMNATTSNIYSLLQTQFGLLISTIQIESQNLQQTIVDESGKLQTVLRTESEAIQGAIADAVTRILLYLDNAFEESVGDLPEKQETTQGTIDSYHEFESGLIESLDEFPFENAFDGIFDEAGIIGGFSLLALVFGSLWNVIGGLHLYIVFSLCMGLVLVLIGRMSRYDGVGRLSSGRLSTKKGGSDSPPKLTDGGGT